MSMLTLVTTTILSLSSFSIGAPSHAQLGNLKYDADIAAPTDVDFYRATLMAGERVRAKIRRAKGSELTPFVDLENAAGQSVGVAMRSSTGRARGQLVNFPWKQIKSSGPYSVVVRGQNGTSGRYVATLEARGVKSARKTGKGKLDASRSSFSMSFEGMEDATLTTRIAWSRKQTPLRLVSITDPDGQPVPVPAEYVQVTKTKINIKNLPLTGRIGTYVLLAEREGAGSPSKLKTTTSYTYHAHVRSPKRETQRKPLELDTSEPTLAEVSAPIDATAGSNVIITGQNFSHEDGVTVLIGDEEADVRGATETILEVTVPEGQATTTHDVTVINADSQTVSEDEYLVVQEDSAAPDPDPAPAPTPIPDDGPSTFEWTEFTASSDTRKVYVSATGNDNNDGLSANRPVRTLSRGESLLRNGYPDWLLIKSGDTFDNQEVRVRNKSGRSASAPMRISTYGSGDRPLMRNCRIYTGMTVSNFAIDSLKFVRTQEEGNPVAAVFALHGGDFFLIENCYFEGYGSNVAVQGFDGPLSDFRFRGCVAVDSYSTQKHSQGLFLNKVDGVLVEGCVFDHNGWNEDIAEAEATIFNHNMYIHPSCTDVTVRNTITANGSSHGLSQPSGGLCEDNLFMRNGVALGFATGGTVRRNVFIDGRNTDSNARGFGIWLERLEGADVYDNILAHQETGTQAVAIQVAGTFSDVSIRNNVVYNWSAATGAAIGLYIPGGASGSNELKDNVVRLTRGTIALVSGTATAAAFTFTGGSYYSPGRESDWFRLGSSNMDLSGWTDATGETGASGDDPNFVDASRTLATYAKSKGLTESPQAFLDEARKQEKALWRDAYTAKGANEYIQAGFTLED